MIHKELNKDFYTVAEFAKLLKLHPNTIYKCVAKGRINAFRIGGGRKSAYRIPASEIHRMAIVDMNSLIDSLITKREGEK